MRSQGCRRGSLDRRRHRGQVRQPLLEKESERAPERGDATWKGSRAENQQGKRLCGDSEPNIKSLK